MNQIILLLVIILTLGSLLPATATIAVNEDDSQPPWQLSDLRLLALPASQDANLSIIAAYARFQGQDLELRLDFWELTGAETFDLQLDLSITQQTNAQEGTTTRRTFTIPVSLMDSSPIEGIRSIKLTREQETLSILFQGNPFITRLPKNSLTISVRKPAANTHDVKAGPVFPFLPTSYTPAPLLLTFYDILPAVTPAQALRRMDGAHTGPFGQRHGLFRLLEASSAYAVPIVLLDLKRPESLSALDYLGKLEWIKSLEAQGLVILPDPMWGDPQAGLQSLMLARQIASRFAFRDSPFVYAPEPLFTRNAGVFFTNLPTDNHSFSRVDTGARLVPIPTTPLPATGLSSRNVPDKALKFRLLQAALSPDPTDLVVTGGSLPSSPWADSLYAADAFLYLASHPWIKILSAQEILAFPTQELSSTALLCTRPQCVPMPASIRIYPRPDGTPAQVNLDEYYQVIRNRLSRPGEAALLESAWLAYLNLTSPTEDPSRQALQSTYLPLLERFSAALAWSGDPVSFSQCSESTLLTDCVLSNQNFYASFDPYGGRLMLLFSLEEGKAVQWIGPTSQFSVGLSEPADWQLDKGPWADPNEIPGAFSDPFSTQLRYHVATSQDSITFSHPDGVLRKEFRLLPTGLAVRHQASINLSTRVPVGLPLDDRFSPGWSSKVASANALHLASDSPPIFHLEGASATITSFTDSSPWIKSPEDPDRAYPRGHYLPFPLSVIEIYSDDGSFSFFIGDPDLKQN